MSILKTVWDKSISHQDSLEVRQDYRTLPGLPKVSRLAVSRPIPVVAPVIKNVCPVRLCGLGVKLSCGLSEDRNRDDDDDDDDDDTPEVSNGGAKASTTWAKQQI